MKITLLQDTIAWLDKTANLQRVGDRVAELAGQTDLVLLPEMFTTGFCTDSLDLAEDMQGVTMRTVAEWAAAFGFAITGSFLATENKKYYNRAFFVTPDGRVATADKRHLFSLGGEDRFLSAGNKRLVIPYKGFNICVLVCYDLRFPVWSRNVASAYDLLVFVANWPSTRMKAWNVLLEARAMENQSYVCGVNRVGKGGDGLNYTGGSKVVDPQGEVILSLPDGQAGAATVELSKGMLDKSRAKFPVWQDADIFSIAD